MLVPVCLNLTSRRPPRLHPPSTCLVLVYLLTSFPTCIIFIINLPSPHSSSSDQYVGQLVPLPHPRRNPRLPPRPLARLRRGDLGTDWSGVCKTIRAERRRQRRWPMLVYLPGLVLLVRYRNYVPQVRLRGGSPKRQHSSNSLQLRLRQPRLVVSSFALKRGVYTREASRADFPASSLRPCMYDTATGVLLSDGSFDGCEVAVSHGNCNTAQRRDLSARAQEQGSTVQVRA